MQSPLQSKMNYSVPLLELLFLLMVYSKFFLFVVVGFFFAKALTQHLHCLNTEGRLLSILVNQIENPGTLLSNYT